MLNKTSVGTIPLRQYLANTMAKPKNPDSASTKSSTKSAVKSIKSLKAAATTTLKTIKRKAANLVSPKKKRKKRDDIPNGDEESVNSDVESTPSRNPSQRASVIDVDEADEEVDIEEAAKKDDAELGECNEPSVK